MKKFPEQVKVESCSSLPIEKQSGILLNVRKPIGWTSNDVVRRAKRQLGVEKIGHAGTLDPSADGVLLLGIGREGTKLIPKLMEMEKEYCLVMELGVETDTLDLSGRIVQRKEPAPINIGRLKETLQRFIGIIEQTPPAFSALHIDGQRAYHLARSGIRFDLPKRRVAVHSLELLEVCGSRLRLRTICSKGLYVRSLVRDLAYTLGEIGYLKKLTRTRIGPYRIEDALSIEEIGSNISGGH